MPGEIGSVPLLQVVYKLYIPIDIQVDVGGIGCILAIDSWVEGDRRDLELYQRCRQYIVYRCLCRCRRDWQCRPLVHLLFTWLQRNMYTYTQICRDERLRVYIRDSGSVLEVGQVSDSYSLLYIEVGEIRQISDSLVICWRGQIADSRYRFVSNMYISSVEGMPKTTYEQKTQDHRPLVCEVFVIAGVGWI